MRTCPVSFISFYCFFFTPKSLQHCESVTTTMAVAAAMPPPASNSMPTLATPKVLMPTHPQQLSKFFFTPQCCNDNNRWWQPPPPVQHPTACLHLIYPPTMTMVTTTSPGTQPHSSAHAHTINPPYSCSDDDDSPPTTFVKLARTTSLAQRQTK